MRRTLLLVTLTCLVSTSGCGSLQSERNLFMDWENQSNQISLALGERDYDKSASNVISALMTGLTNKGLTPINVDTASGFLLFEGRTPLSRDEFYRLESQMTDEINAVSSRWWVETHELPKRRISVNVLTLNSGKTRVRLRINSLSPSGERIDTFPPMTQREYLLIWESFEHQLFINNAIDN